MAEHMQRKYKDVCDVCEGRAEWGRQTGFREQQEFQIPGLDGFMSYIRLDTGSDMPQRYFVEISCMCWNISNTLGLYNICSSSFIGK